MRLALVLAFSVSFPVDAASAHCFTVWGYKTLQHCHAGHVRERLIRVARLPPSQAEAPPAPREPSSKIIDPSPEDLDHALALELLEEAIKRGDAAAQPIDIKERKQ